MKGDFTRFTHRPAKHYSRVLEQQGRVRLDADHNEWVEILTHLERTEAVDVIGRCGVPKHGGGFAIAANGDGTDLTISRGRIYVDGILCSNEEEGEPDPVPLGEQADLPGYEPPVEEGADGVYLVYLDVWERHVTALEDPEIREAALGGPDTTTRTRVLCQVKLDPLRESGSIGEMECRPFEAPAADGRLAARAEPTEETSDPCVLPAEAGYRGLENRLYRVEIHDDGRNDEGNQVHEPTFKWSRDNGSVVLPLADGGIDGDEVTVRTLGPDEVLTLRQGDWVEVVGDETELHGRHGTMARVEPGGVDRADRELTLSADVSGHASEGHPKVRRWDHQETDDIDLRDGALPIQGDWFELEDGVEVRFDPDASYHVGDHWVIPARTRQGTVLWPREGTTFDDLALPRLGIEHHYCTLALARRKDGEWTEVRDCRPSFPPLTELESCCCSTVTVGDGRLSHGDVDDLAAGWRLAKERVDDGDAVEIQILAGDHQVSETVVIDRNRVTVRGCGPASRVRASVQGPAFAVQGSEVTFERFVLEDESDEDESKTPLIRSTSDRLAIRRLELANRAGPLLEALEGAGLELVDSRCRVGRTAGVDLGGRDILVARNRFESFAGGIVGDGRGAIHFRSGVEDAAVLDNQLIGCPGHGITLGGLTKMVFGGTYLDLSTSANVEAELPSPFLRRVLIARNRITGAAGSGITSTWIARETVDEATAEEGNGRFVLESAREAVDLVQLPAPIEDLTIADNLVRDGIRLGADLGPRQDGAPYGGIVLGHVDRLRIAGNEITGNGRQPPESGAGAVPVAGIFLEDVRRVEISGNLVVDNGVDAEGQRRHSGPEGGIVVLEAGVELEEIESDVVSRRPAGPAAAAIHHNRVESVRGLVLQLEGSGPMQVHGNLLSRLRRKDDPKQGAVQVINTGLSPIFAGAARLHGLSGLLEAEESHPLLTMEPDILGGPVSFCDNQLRYIRYGQRGEAEPVTIDARPRGEAEAVAVGLMSFDDVTFSDNRMDCRLYGEGLRLFTDALVLGGTVRSQDNGLSETLGAALVSLLSLGIVQSTGTGNQGTHCILIAGGPWGNTIEDHNSSLCCAEFFSGIFQTGRDLSFPCPDFTSIKESIENIRFTAPGETGDEG